MAHSLTGYSLWGGRFSSGSSDKNELIMKKFNSSYAVDKRLWKQDLSVNKAWAKAIYKVNLLSTNDLQLILKGVDQIEREWEKGTFVENENDEDIHTANERRLKELIGDVGMKLHTGKSRNDQVVSDMKLWLKEALYRLELALKTLINTLINRSEDEIEIIMPGYTHLQRAQPIRWSHLLLSYACPIHRDVERIKQLKYRIDECPLGSGAIAGNPFQIDRETLSQELNFRTFTFNSIDATANRDFICEFLFINTNIAITLSKLAEDLIIYNTAEFSFVRLSDSFCTGSSLMPQKKNADSLELIRGKAGKLMGIMTGFMITVKAIPTSYNKDLQEDKQAMFDSFDTTLSIVQIATGVLQTLTINETKMLNALSTDLLATDLAYYLVRKQVPFRVAHLYAGQCVQLAEKENSKLEHLSLEKYKYICESFDEDVFEIFKFEKSVEQYKSIGGTAKSSIIEQIKFFKNIYND